MPSGRMWARWGQSSITVGQVKNWDCNRDLRLPAAPPTSPGFSLELCFYSACKYSGKLCFVCMDAEKSTGIPFFRD